MLNKLEKKDKQTFLIQSVLLIVMVLTWIIIISLEIRPTLINNGKCFFYYKMGIYCPGCGGTRAVESLLYGDIFKSLFYHPVILYSLLIFIWSEITYILNILTNKKIKIYKLSVKHLVIIDAIFIFCFVIRNLLVLYFGYYIF